MPYPPKLSSESLEYQLTALHFRQNGFLPPSHRALQRKYEEHNISIVNVVENTYTGILTVVLKEPVSNWTGALVEAISKEAAEGASVLKDPEVRFGSFSYSENAG